MKEAKLVITLKKLDDNCIKMEINGTHGINWAKYIKKSYESMISALEDQFEKDSSEDATAEDVLKHLAELAKTPLKEITDEFNKMEGKETEKITKLTIKYLKKSLDDCMENIKKEEK
ncbi:MAG: hypothetical protein J6S67_23255 [Methanobrevibacter sp.]|nr:hypothetical protein [Methanobrevibacter sp.]